MFNISELLSQKWPVPSKTKVEAIYRRLKKKYPNNEDPWGLNLGKVKPKINMLWPLYKNYFQVRVFGKENVTDKNYLIVANHSGQIAIDGMLLGAAFLIDIWPPRLIRPMVERFFTGIPFVGSWAAEAGAVLGDRQNAARLLKSGETILAFPEGVKGIAKNTSEFYKLQNFSQGFFRLALSSNVEVLPIAIIGAEEFFPLVYQAKKLARWLGLPALPVTPLPFPLPSPVDIYIGKPYQIPKDLSCEASDDQILPHVKNIQAEIDKMINEGLQKRRKFWGNKLTKPFMKESNER